MLRRVVEFTRADSDKIAQTKQAMDDLKANLPMMLEVAAKNAAAMALAEFKAFSEDTTEKACTAYKEVFKLKPTVGLMKWFIGGIGLASVIALVDLFITKM